MNLNIYTVHDEKTSAFLQPMFFRTTGEAIRAIQSCIIDQNHQFSQHKTDFSLVQIGEYDDNTGNINPLEKKIWLGNMIELSPTPPPTFDDMKKQLESVN